MKPEEYEELTAQARKDLRKLRVLGLDEDIVMALASAAHANAVLGEHTEKLDELALLFKGLREEVILLQSAVGD